MFRAALASALAAIACPALAAPGNSHTIQGTAGGEVLNPGTLAKMNDMIFGSIGGTTAPGTVILNPATSVCTKTGPIVLSGTCEAAVFDGMGNRRAVVRLNVSNSITLTGSNGGSMLLDNFTLDTAPDLVLAGRQRQRNRQRQPALRYRPGFEHFHVPRRRHLARRHQPDARRLHRHLYRPGEFSVGLEIAPPAC